MEIGWRMEGVTIVIFFFSLVFILSGCNSQPAPYQTGNSNSQTTPFNQTINVNASLVNSDSEHLDSVIQEGIVYIISRIPINSKIGVVNMQSSSINLSNYIIDNTIMHLVNTERFIVVERSGLDIIQREQQYQLSGEVSDATAISIGQQLGIQFIITGSIMPLGNNYSLGLKIINVQTAQIMGQRMYTVRSDIVLLSLLNPSVEKPVVVDEPRNDTPQQVIMGDVNITNNTTTTIHGDVHVNMPQGFFGR